MEIKVDFDPESLTPEDEAYPAFKAGGIPLKFWALYKSSHITTQKFRPALEKLVVAYSEMFDEESGVEPYSNIEEFMALLKKCKISVRAAWLIEHWDYFNLNIRKKLTVSYTVHKELA